MFNHGHLKKAELLGRIMSLYGVPVEISQFDELKASLPKGSKIYPENVIKSYIDDINHNAKNNPKDADSILEKGRKELFGIKKCDVIEDGQVKTYYIKKSDDGDEDDDKETDEVNETNENEEENDENGEEENEDIEKNNSK